ncbi:right-handed parallel beta-helix repeat-containing protein [uncultured Tateyamaria sp.]|uniref:right-handed parallel beta-helix repeat-containing protein n=1 Tax=uncultured Tateyamaria sp. TaxID=455651 RepID=UPI00261FC8B9|nr:right-handed parallel beta-helix repeat-containing protein [uncultured Tateyamaria sp.]
MAVYYVSPTGTDTNSGTSLDQPLSTIAAAHELVNPGDTIYLRGGTYDLPLDTTTTLSKSGTADAPIRLMAYQDEVPILDGSAWTKYDDRNSNSILITQTGDYWHVEGLEITGGPRNGYLAFSVEGSVFKDLNIHHNDNTGLQLYGDNSNNLILGGEFHHNFDAANNGQDADGIGIKFGSGEGNVVDGVRMYNNSDDGIDMWDFDGSVTIRNSESFGHGVDRWDHGPLFEGNGNGFKLSGGDASSVTETQHVLHNNIAWGNTTRGFDYNNSAGSFDVYNNTAYDNGYAGFNFASGTHELRNNLSFDNGVNQLIGDSVVDTANSWSSDVDVTADDFVSLDPTSPDFLRLAEDSDLVDAGVPAGTSFNGSAPDLGAFEFGPDPDQTGTIEGRFFIDTNGNNKFDEGDRAVSDHRVQLRRDGEKVAVTRTDADGNYDFQDVLAQDGYRIRFFQEDIDLEFSNQRNQYVGNAGNLNSAKLTVEAGETALQDGFFLDWAEACVMPDASRDALQGQVEHAEIDTSGGYDIFQDMEAADFIL